MFMGRVHGKASARFVKPVRARAVLCWTPEEKEIVQQAIDDDLDLDETHALLPYRTRDSVKDMYYRFREPQDRDDPASLSDARRQKDAIEGSAKLYDALVKAGL